MQFQTIAAHHKSANCDFTLMHHFMMFGTQRDKIVAMVLVKMLNIPMLIGTFLRFDVMHFIDVFIAQGTL